MIRHLWSSRSPDPVLTKKIVIQKSSGGTDSFWLWMGCGNDVGTQKWEGTVHMAVIRALTGFSVEWVQWIGYNWPIYTAPICFGTLYSLFKSQETQGKNLEKKPQLWFAQAIGMLVLFLHLPHHDLLQCGAKMPRWLFPQVWFGASSIAVRDHPLELFYKSVAAWKTLQLLRYGDTN